MIPGEEPRTEVVDAYLVQVAAETGDQRARRRALPSSDEESALLVGAAWSWLSPPSHLSPARASKVVAGWKVDDDGYRRYRSEPESPRMRRMGEGLGIACPAGHRLMVEYDDVRDAWRRDGGARRDVLAREA